MKTDKQGCSTCPAGGERFEKFTTPAFRRSGVATHHELIQYDYRTPDGRLFSCVAETLMQARLRRDEWLNRRQRVEEREADYGGVLGADGNVYSDADPGL